MVDPKEREFWRKVRRGFLGIVAAIDDRYDFGPSEHSEPVEAMPRTFGPDISGMQASVQHATSRVNLTKTP